MDKKELLAISERYYKMMVEDNDFTSINAFMETFKVNTILRYVMYAKSLDDDDIRILGSIIKILQAIYNNSGFECPISDEDYDKLYEIYISYSNNDIVGSVNSGNKKTAFHKYPDLRGTLDKVHFITKKERGKDTRKSFEDWLKTCENKLGYSISRSELIEVYPKFDGVSIIFELDENGVVERALTRGDVHTNEATDISTLFKGMIMKPSKDGRRMGLKTECVIPIKAFDKYINLYGEFNSPRSAISSIVNNIDHNVDLLRFVCCQSLTYQYEGEDIIHTDEYLKKVYGTVMELGTLLDYGVPYSKEKWEKMNGIVIDGLVFRFSSKTLQEELGREGAINKYEVAYKYPPETKKSIILDVDFSIGNLGQISPVAKIEPIKINRNTVSSVSLGSIDRFESLQLSPGDEVLIKYDIIPYLDIDSDLKKSGKPKFETPKVCPVCGEPLGLNPTLSCINENCDSRVIGKILNYCIKMGIDNISIGTITTLFERGFLRSILDLYKLEFAKKDLQEIPGFGKKSVKIMLNSIEKSRDTKEDVFLGALGITGIGAKTFKKVLDIYHIDGLREIAITDNSNKLTSIAGIKQMTADKIVDGIKNNLHIIDHLMHILNIRQNGGSDCKVCFTGVRDKDFEKYLESHDIEVSESLTKDTNILIIKTKDHASSKVDKAKKYGIRILSLDEAYSEFRYR